MIRAVQDDLVTPVGQGRPAVLEVPDVVRPGRLEPARAERALASGQVGTLLPPRGDDDMGPGQRVDTQVSVAHGLHHMRRPALSTGKRRWLGRCLWLI